VLEVDRGDARLRLDRLLVARLPETAGLSRTRLAAWIREGRVEVDGVPARRAAQRLRPGQSIALELPDAPQRIHLPDARALSILHEDDALVAVDKPAGLVAHPTRRHPTGTLMNAVLAHLGGGPVHLVHRLDRDTSGVVLIAKTAEVHARLARAMARRAVQKDYLAVVYGAPVAARDRIDLPIRRDAETRRMVVDRDAGLKAATEVEWLASAGALTLVRCRLVTGRLHQIRVHLAAIGLPIVGDPIYGQPRWKGIDDPAGRSACAGFPRQALHAWRVSCAHPVTAAPLVIVAPLPPDLQALVDALALAVPQGSANAT
jgi:23S rRNA pseudouridine1911/1915/1917 synthase